MPRRVVAQAAAHVPDQSLGLGSLSCALEQILPEALQLGHKEPPRAIEQPAARGRAAPAEPVALREDVVDVAVAVEAAKLARLASASACVITSSSGDGGVVKRPPRSRHLPARGPSS